MNEQSDGVYGCWIQTREIGNGDIEVIELSPDPTATEPAATVRIPRAERSDVVRALLNTPGALVPPTVTTRPERFDHLRECIGTFNVDAVAEYLRLEGMESLVDHDITTHNAFSIVRAHLMQDNA